MPQSARLKQRSEKFDQNSITKTNNKGKAVSKKDQGVKVGPVVLAVLLFVVVGSAILQILRGS